MPDEDEKQCRICLDGVTAELELGRLIRPCLCKGSISYVHVKCLQRWRNSSPNQSAFFSCPQCHYRYRFSRTKALGIATNPFIVGGLSAFIFTLITLLSSFVTTYLLAYFQGPSSSSFYLSTSSYFFFDPTEVIHDLVKAALRILQDQDSSILDAESILSATQHPIPVSDIPRPGFLKRFVQRFVIGLPLVGAGSLLHMLLSAPLIGPVHWLARYRGNRRRNNDTRDISALIITVLIVLGAARALYAVYRLTERMTKRILLRAEDAILEVN